MGTDPLRTPVPINDNFVAIAKQIVAEGKSLEQWVEIESDDLIQLGDYEGGLDADEGEFCFSWWRGDDEFWFQVSLEQIEEIARGHDVELHGRKADQ